MQIKVKESHKKNEAIETIPDLLYAKGYTPMEASDNERIIAYILLSTGIETPSNISVVATYYYKDGQFSTEVLIGDCEKVCTENGSPKDLYCTFIGNDPGINNMSVEMAKGMLSAAEKAAKLYIKALNQIKQV